MRKFHSLCSFFLLCGILTLSACNTTGSNPWGSPKSATQTPDDLSRPETQQTKDISDVYAEPPTTTQIDFSNLPPVKIGILLPLSGKHERIGQSMLQAAQLAVFDMGYDNFELIPRDTQGTPQGALQATTSAMNDGAQLLLGPLFADSVRAAKQAAARKNINVIAFSTDWTLAGGNAYVMGFLPFAQVQRVTRYAAANGMRDIGVLAPADKYGDTVVNAFKQNATANAIRITKNMRYRPSSKDLTRDVASFAKDLVDENEQSLVDAVFVPAGGVQAKTLASALSYYGLTPRNVRRLGTGLLDDPNLAREPNLQGAWFAAPSPTQRRGFESRYMNTYGNKPPRVASLAYDATALASVLAASGFQNTSTPAFSRNAITNPNGFSGIDGIFRFGQNGLVERGLAVLEIRNGRFVEINPAPKTFQSKGYAN